MGTGLKCSLFSTAAMALKINPLAVPKGKDYACELCGRVAVTMCQFCRSTYYCSHDHRTLDWDGIHEKICGAISVIRGPAGDKVGSDEERAARENELHDFRMALIEAAKNEAMRYLARGDFELAIPGALQALRHSAQVFGQGRLELIPHYLLLAEANMGLDRHKQAEEYLSLANWAVVKTPDVGLDVRSQLHRNFGKLYASQGRHEEALQQLAHDVYYSSLMVGPEHVDTCAGYYSMGNVFYSLQQNDASFGFYSLVVDIWKAFLQSENCKEELTEPKREEGIEVLSRILEKRASYYGQEHLDVAEVHLSLGLLHETCGERLAAKEQLTLAIDLYERNLGANHETTMQAKEALTRALEMS